MQTVHVILNRLSAFLVFAFCSHGIHAATVTKLQAHYRDGQVFLAWQNVTATGQAYKVYRSSTPFTSADQLNSTTYIGQVRDSSSKNLRRSRLEQMPIYFRWQPNGEPLGSNIGLYVVTCTETGLFYYAVTVMDLASGVEDKTLLSGKNTLINPVSETVAFPLPVWQDSVVWSNGDVVHYYAQFGDNRQNVYRKPFNNVGSFGYNFFQIRRGQAERYPLFVFLEGLQKNAIKGNGLDPFDTLSNCIILSLDDWIPYPDGYHEEAGKSTGWVGYHTGYDIYVSDNPIPTSGVVMAYTQHRIIHTIEWARNYLPVDTTKVFLVGVSTGGLGALITAALVPEKITGVYAIAHPTALKSGDGWHQQLWGTASTNLKTNVPDMSNLNDSLRIFDLMNIKKLFMKNYHRSLPHIWCVHGKQDATVGWSDKPSFYDTAQLYKMPAVFFWDRRKHNGDEAKWLDTETLIPYQQLALNVAYPAFSNCSVNGNPGNGKKNDGDAFGTINGLLAWSEVSETKCSFSVKLYLKDYVVGGQLQANQPTSCSADVTLRRLQAFKAQPGRTIYWYNYDASGNLVQSGTITSQQGVPHTVPGVQISKAGNRLELKFGTCLSREAEPEGLEATLRRYGGGWQLVVSTAQPQDALIRFTDPWGRLQQHQEIFLDAGTQHIALEFPLPSLYVVELQVGQQRWHWKVTE
ncbi:MAG: alpha/beta hydrolase [Chitinophagales bacterium]|nr:alpha/beta hydrolase [Chitinophagales bacterium]MDW8427769.1 alpha/beta hydrolase-fold protein [Chitinophagales bacterium]